MDTTIAKI